MIKASLIGLLVCFVLAGYGQTIEDLTKLGLTDAQLRMSLEKRLLLLTSEGSKKKKKLKKGGFARIKLKNDTTIIEGILEAFLNDSMIVSSYAPKLDNQEIIFGFSEYQAIAFKDVEVISYSIRHRGGGSWGSFLLTLVGMEMVLLPVIMPVLIGNTEEVYSQTQFPFMIAGGVVMYYFGRRLHKSLILKDYYLGTEWDYEVVKK
jgi:hypothetical protein